MSRRPSFLLSLSLLIFAAGLLIWSFSRIRWQEVGDALRSLHLWQILLLLGLNLGIVGLFNVRWWILLRLQGHKVPFFSLAVYRLAGFGVSYLTPGPQFGGEGWLVVLLHRRHAISYPQASASVALDKLLELLANFSFLAFGLTFSLGWRMRATNLSVAFLFPLIGLLMIPFLLFAMLAGGILPATWLLERWRRAPPLIRSLGSAIAVAEGHSAALIRQRFIAIVALFFYSLAIWVAMIGEYWLSLHFLGVKANLSQTLLALTAARLAFLTPLPGGMGALEAAQVIAFQTIGLGAALGMSLSLLQRARDLFLALLGIVFGSLLHLRSPLTLRPQPSSET